MNITAYLAEYSTCVTECVSELISLEMFLFVAEIKPFHAGQEKTMF